MTEALALAIDVGGTTLKGAVFTADGTVLSRRTRDTFATAGDAYAGVESLVAELRDDAGARPIAGLGLCTPGTVRAAEGVVDYAANLGWAELPLAETLQRRFGIPVALDHDARAGARAERASRSPDRALTNGVFLPLGTGVSAAVIIAGEIRAGARGAAGEFGHMPLVAGGERCACGSLGCVEVYASAAAVLRRYHERGGTHAHSTRELVARLPEDPDAAIVWAEALDVLAQGIMVLSALLDPAEIVLGGGLAEAGAVLIDPLRDRIAAGQRWRRPPRLTLSALGPRAGLIGAGLLARPSGAVSARAVAAMNDGLRSVPETERESGPP